VIAVCCGAAKHGFDKGREFDQQPVAVGLYHPAIMSSYFRREDVLDDSLQPLVRCRLILLDETAITDHVSGQDRREPTVHGRCSRGTILNDARRLPCIPPLPPSGIRCGQASARQNPLWPCELPMQSRLPAGAIPEIIPEE
jgi:hypothetical protein